MADENTRPRFVTPPFVPDPTINQVQGDPYAGLTQVLQQLQSQQYTPPKEGTLQTILNALAGGASVLASNDSGAALSNLLQSRQQKQMQIEQIKQQHQNVLMQASIQGALEKARGIQQGQLASQARKEESVLRGQEYSNKRLVDLDFDLKAKNQEEDWLNANLPMIVKRTQLTSLAQKYPELLDKSTQRQIAMRSLIPQMPANIAKELADNYSNISDKPLSEEAKVWDEQYATKLGLFNAQDRLMQVEKGKADIEESQAKAKLYEAEANKNAIESLTKPSRNVLEEIFTKSIMEKASDGPHRILQDGTVITNSEYVKLQGNIMGSQSLRGSRPLNELEEGQYIQKQVRQLKTMQQEIQNIPNDKQPGANPATNLSPNEIQDNIEQLRKAGKTDQQIREFMQGKGFSDEDINKYLTPIAASTESNKSVSDTTQTMETRQVFDSKSGRWITERVEKPDLSRDSVARSIQSLSGKSTPDSLSQAYMIYDVLKAQNPNLSNTAILEKAREANQRKRNK